MASIRTNSLIRSSSSQNPSLNLNPHHHHLISSSSSSFQFPPNPFSSSLRLTLSKTETKINRRLGFYKNPPPISSSFNQDNQTQYPKPTEIPWSKELANTVHLIGNVGNPVQIKYLDSGKVLAWTSLAVRRSPTETTWFNLTFWNELAHIANQHVEKGQRLYVTGNIVSNTVDKDDGSKQTYYKVVVRELNFVEKIVTPGNSSSYEREPSPVITAGQGGNYAGKSGTSTQELWQAFFANPVDWWDNRKNKRTPKHPDFKHKHTGEALWVDAKYNPPWVKSQLAILDTTMASHRTNEDNSVRYMSSDELTLF
ncbi:hypothetical protein C5167_018837 [Papaver somniferum]|uniref:Single-stranded DNA-binding protein n=1 Tax=Papaver somniferum TaxID=3469 RepID=A0A4Y7IRJ2_PAPSO|nr:protein OSB4, chloroplastic-like [Papaver somniferum]RZC50420.1 hypothetical protein C5167_018837 [Papaver somniferum]